MANKLIKHNGDIIMYQTEDGATKVEVVFGDDTVWLTQEQIAELFQKSKSTINEHLQNIYAEEELVETEVMTKFGNSEFSRQRPTQHYNLDAILAVGYRVKSHRGIQFRKWATQLLKEYMRKGFVMNDDLLKQAGGGTYAHKDIAFEFGMWISPEFKIYLVKEFQRLKDDEQKLLGWSAKRELAKINYRIHADAIKESLPKELTVAQLAYVYASEADMLNMALFGITAKEWRDSNPDKSGNIRDYANINQLICLSNMESINAILIEDGLTQNQRLKRLNQIAISQMTTLEGIVNRKLLK